MLCFILRDKLTKYYGEILHCLQFGVETAYQISSELTLFPRNILMYSHIYCHCKYAKNNFQVSHGNVGLPVEVIGKYLLCFAENLFTKPRTEFQ